MSDNSVGIPSARPPRKRRRLLVALSAALVVLLVGGAAVWFFVFRTTNDDRYLAELKSSHLLSGFASADVAVSQGHAFCTKLSSGSAARGYKSQRVAVKNLCPEYLSGFVVIPTPAEQQSDLTTQLRDAGLAGKFASDAAAVAHAKSVCSALDAGGAQQGPAQDAIAVSVYCGKYAAGFKTLHPIVVKGSISLMESDPSDYFPSITGGASSCSGGGGYSDMRAGTEVVVKNAQGQVLTTTQLGRGTGIPPYLCEFKFRFTVMDGEVGKYSIEVADRGALHYTAAELKVPDTVSLTLGE